MSSYFDEASLVMIPSGYKTSKLYSVKPTDGSGDMAFTRSNDTATRVGPDGLIEKVRTNLVLQSNTFNTTWTTTSASVTSGQAGYDGTNNAWLLTKSGASGRINQSFTATAGLTTFSVYAKANASSYIAIEFSTSYIYVNLTNGAQGSVGAGTYKIESIGSGWYRISMTAAAASSIFRIYPAENNDLSATTGSIFIQNAQVETGDIATDYIATTSAAVSVGPVANVPRLDYLNSSCPRLLLEPQRTNLATYSEQFDNAAWTKIGSAITANATISPDGTQNADKLTEDTSTGNHRIVNTAFAVNNGNAHSQSWYVKYFNNQWIQLNRGQEGSGYLNFDLINGVVGYTGGITDYQISAMANGWYRISINYVVTGTYATAGISILNTNVNTRYESYVGDGTSGVYIWGCQYEQGSYVSSYIPSLGAAVTRGADACSKTGISSLIGSTEGVLYAEVDVELLQEAGRILLDVNDNNTTNRVLLGLSGSSVIGFVQGSTRVSYTLPSAGVYKFAFAYKSGDFALYVNGVQQSVSSDSLSFSGMNQLFLGHTFDINNTQPVDGIKSALLFKTRLSNADLAALTA